VFDRWIGAAILSDTFSMVSRLLMPDHDVSVSAIRTPSAAWTPVRDTINGSEVYYYFPSSYKGLISFHHGHGGNAAGWFGKVENLQFLRYVVAHGYAVFATESRDRTNKLWDTRPNSVDISNIMAILDTLRGRGLLSASTRLFGVGMSQGSGFTSMIACVKGFAANALYCVPGIDTAIAVTQSPTQWCIARNDTADDPLRLAKSEANCARLRGRGIGAEIFVNEPSPVVPTRFWRVPGIDSSASREIHDDLRAAGYLDGRDFLTINPALDSSWYSHVKPAFQAHARDIEDQLYVCFTAHKFFSDFSSKTIAFFDTYSGSTKVFKSKRATRPAICQKGISSHENGTYDLRGARIANKPEISAGIWIRAIDNGDFRAADIIK
jgi:hypothetical protein